MFNDKDLVLLTFFFIDACKLDELCELVTNLLLRLLSDGLANCHNPDMFLKVKLLLMLYIQTMEVGSRAALRVLFEWLFP